MNSTGTGFGIMDGGVGQGTTTREFGEETGALYSGGGGGGMNNFTSDTQANHKPNGGARLNLATNRPKSEGDEPALRLG